MNAAIESYSFRRIRSSAKLAGLSALLMVTAACGSEGSEPDSLSNPILQVEPSSDLVFNEVSDFSTDTQFVTITNVGAGALVITSVETDMPGVFNVTGTFPSEEIGAAESDAFTVSFTPATGVRQDGTLTIRSNGGSATLDLVVEFYGTAFVAPNAIEFGRVAAGADSSESVIVQNIGDRPLVVHDIQVEPAGSFELDTELALPMELQPSDLIELEVLYTSGTEAPPSTVLVVTSNDAETPRLEVPINVSAP